MFKGFNIKDVTFDNISSMKEEYMKKNKKQLLSIKSDFVEPIESYLKEGMIFDGDSLKQGWFPSKENFVFPLVATVTLWPFFKIALTIGIPKNFVPPITKMFILFSSVLLSFSHKAGQFHIAVSFC